MRCLRRTVAALFVASLAVCPVLSWRATPVYAATTARSDAETSLLDAWVRYSVQGNRDLFGVPLDAALARREFARLADRLRPAVSAARGGPAVVDAFRRVLFGEERFAYDRSPGNPDNYLIGAVLARRRGNCLGLSLLWLSLAQQFGLPFRGVYVPGHMFVRYEGGGASENFEFSDASTNWDDGRYRERFRLSEDGPYLRSLTPEKTLGVFLKSLGAAYDKAGRDREALDCYAQAARFYPDLPDVSYNAGVSLQRLGRRDEAVAMYRHAVGLDPDMASARGNLGILLALQGHYDEAIAQGRLAAAREPWSAAAHGNLASTYCACGRYVEGIVEFQRAADLDPRNAPVLAGLVRAYVARGEYREAARVCDRAMALGCRFEPSILKALSDYRDVAPRTDAVR
jgi:tetratricopeptide (TPR) repeat protein